MRTLVVTLVLGTVAAAAPLVGGCAGATTPAPADTPQPPPSSTSTVSIPSHVPTPSVTPAPSATPFSDLQAFAGPVVFESQFTPDENWRLGTDTAGGVSLSRQTLVVAVSRPNASRFVLAPTPSMTDFLIEVSVRASLCGGEDEIGVMFRVNPQGDHYRFTLDCQGVVRVTRVVGGATDVLGGPSVASSAIPGSPAENRLSVLGRETSFTFLVNGVEVLQVRDPLLLSGTFGFFVRSASQGQTTAALTAFRLRSLLPPATASPPG